ncbi:MAG TPA: gluconate 2-dehydrogenase subunit 3 family protein [Myxococcaceae bacterium]|nr:gluconate 2-dehydrogenase subunit 3 family protein [Myxococcaceae bacterium]
MVLVGSCSRQPAPEKQKAEQASAPFTTSHVSLTDPEYDAMAAACERLLPRDDDPGAADLGVPGYVDRALSDRRMSHVRDDFVRGLQALMQRAKALHHKAFPELAPEQQDALLTEYKNSPKGSGEGHFYELLVVLTMEGAFSDPSYGGNRDRRGWALIGFETSEPPPGYDGLHTGHKCGG